jgi:hypothetical protein
MPKVNGKSFPYTVKGKAAAKNAAKKTGTMKKVTATKMPRKGGKV